ncbi:MAG: DUF4082 domain-containing protein [Actinobacteria bacterium]|nr:DUF4082 domain-containing protein [Actinomycetota bacterium]
MTTRVTASLIARLTVALLVVASLGQPPTPATAVECSGNATACENQLPGSPASEWDDFSGSGDPTIQGYGTDISVNAGGHIDFKIRTTATAYQIAIYRLGWYRGLGARKVAQITPSATLPQSQPACVVDPATQLVDCGNWAVSAGWDVPASAVSGVYLAVLRRPDTGGASHIPFIVRSDASHSDLVFQTADTTWQAYNSYGGASLYSAPAIVSGGEARAVKVSYNRPFSTRSGASARDYLMDSEYAMIRFLERNGYDVSYISGVDADRLGGLLKNHKTYLSVGHDEYWSGKQRLNVEAARDAGVNLAFFSGNEVYWKTRYEQSIAGTPTDYRTVVCYKESRANGKVDPSPEWTGTWRDPRFSSDGGKPENALTGTMYMVNFDDLPLTVSAAEGKNRFWRNTSAASLATGQTITLSPSIIGYESDEDIDNGFRPAGLILLSTTTGSTPQYLTDFGRDTTAGTTTHHLTLYRAASGALVFGAGTIRWPWGLDNGHDVPGGTVNLAMQQATVNLMADMGAQPQTPMPGLVSADPSSDTSAPSVAITSPTSGSFLSGSQVTVTGTASDQGGRVAAVEVSLDGGVSYHRATGTATWTYAGALGGLGAGAIRARASDDSANVSTPVTSAAATTCPCVALGDVTPAQPDAADASAVELGVRVRPTEAGWITGVRFYKSAANTGTHLGSLWSTSGALLASGTFTNETPSGWQTLTFPAPVAVTANTTYVVSYYAPAGHYAAGSGADLNSHWYGPKGASPIQALGATPSVGNGVYGVGHRFPDRTFGAANYYVDVIFDNQDRLPPQLVSTIPVSGASSVPTTLAPSAVLSKPIQAGSLTMTMKDSSNATVAGAVSYDETSRRATYTPAAELARSTTYSVSVQATDTVGNAMPTTTWTFTTAAPDGQSWVCPCQLWDDDYVPASKADSDSAALELGVRFSAQADGQVTGIRFYKGVTNTGTHTGSLWSASGTRLATGTFTNESAEGWQTLTFANPVAITAGSSYVASYFAPQGHYAADPGALAGGRLAPPLVVPNNGGAYRYGSASAFPTNSSAASYAVQPVFTTASGVKPTVATSVPLGGTTSVRIDLPLSVTFAVPVATTSATLALATQAGLPVPGSVSFDSTSRIATFTPTAPLAPGTAHRLTISGATSASGQVMDPVTVPFTTAGVTACPCTVFSSTARPVVEDAGDTNGVSLGLRFSPTSNGTITGVRFYKAAGNGGSHTGSLWSSTGARLATGTFTGETASGWQQLTFAVPVSVVSGQTYVVSYYAPQGHYAADVDAVATGWTNGPLSVPGTANGAYAYGVDQFPNSSYRNTNYWVDPVFSTNLTPDTQPPSVTATSPVAGSSSVDPAGGVSATFDEAISPSSLVMTLKTSAGSPVAGAATYDQATKKATFSPSSTLGYGTTYTATVNATDAAGNAMGAPVTWSFTTMAGPATPGTCPCGLWDDTAIPAVIDSGDTSTVELGVRFSVSRPGQASAVRFYKAAANTGPHVVNLWDANGNRLATGTSTSETATGWQTVTFPQPVPLTAGSTYVASYVASAGHYAYTAAGFATALTVTPLSAPTGAGVFRYGGGFPTASWNNTNYWVDPVITEP